MAFFFAAAEVLLLEFSSSVFFCFVSFRKLKVFLFSLSLHVFTADLAFSLFAHLLDFFFHCVCVFVFYISAFLFFFIFIFFEICDLLLSFCLFSCCLFSISC